jgi:glycosyltransferase involved in cell wall biosynthesis
VPHLIYLAYGFPPAAKSGSFRMRAVANAVAQRGWDVTALSLADDSWWRENGVDRSLLEGLHPRIRRVGLEVAREDLEPDLRLWSEDRARDPDAWRRDFTARSQLDFPEVTFGLWRSAWEEAVTRVHAERPADLLLASPMPYVTLAAARHLNRTAGVPYVIDYRDGWSLDVVSGETAFSPDSPAGVIEQDVLEHAAQAWFVNGPIRDFYAARYPSVADRFAVVRNGFDPELEVAVTHRDPVVPPLVFGYLGTMSLGVPQLTALLDGWALARSREPLLADARLEFRGHMGAGYAAGVGGHAALVTSRAAQGVSYGGPVSKAEVASVYSGWDALVLALIGGRYVTSGKVYEYLATGLPIVSAHEKEHAAAEVLSGYPLWAPTASLSPEDLADAFEAAARLAVHASPEQRRGAVVHAEQFSRALLLEPAVERMLALVGSPTPETPAPPVAPSPPAPPVAVAAQQVLLVAAKPIVAQTVRDAVAALVAAGHTVRLVSRTAVKAAIGDAEVRQLKGGGRAQRFSGEWFRIQWRTRVVSRLARRAPLPRATWLELRSDPVARAWARSADTVVALDRYAAFAAWQAVRDRPESSALLGLTEARRRLL